MARERPPTVVDPSVEPVERWRWPRLKGEKKGRKPKGKGGGKSNKKKEKEKKRGLKEVRVWRASNKTATSPATHGHLDVS